MLYLIIRTCNYDANNCGKKLDMW